MAAKLLLAFLLLPLAMPGNAAQDRLQFALIADPQYADKASTADRCYRDTLAKLTTAVPVINASRPAFLVILGDYIDGYTSADRQRALEDLTRANAGIAAFEGDVHMVLGNHDVASLNKDEWLANTPGKVKRTFYSFDVGAIHFVVLDGNYTADGKDYGREEPWIWTDTWIQSAQKAWLIDDLNRAGDMPTVVFIHQNIQDHTAYSLKNSSEIRQILQTHGNVTHVLQGHRHTGQYSQISGIHYLTLPAMVNCPPEGNNYAVATISGSTMHVQGYGSTPTRDMPHAGLLKARWRGAGSRLGARDWRLATHDLRLPTRRSLPQLFDLCERPLPCGDDSHDRIGIEHTAGPRAAARVLQRSPDAGVVR